MILNDAQLDAQLLFDFKGIIDEVSYKILQALLESIEKEVYNAGIPQLYHRHRYAGGLLGSWEKSDAKILGQEVYSRIDSNLNMMVTYPDEFIHGSNHWVMDDIRELLAEIIIEGKSGPLFGEGFWTQPRDFWTPVIEMLTNGKVDKLIENAMTTRGIIWRKF